MGAGAVERAARVDTEKKLDEIVEALDHFHSVNTRLPCVAGPAATEGDSGYGVEIHADCVTTTTNVESSLRVDAGGAVYVRIGSLPVRDLYLRDELMEDGWGNRFTYAVTEQHTTKATFASNGAITIKDASDGDIATDLSYVVFSHGTDGKGAYRMKTGLVTSTACGSTTEDDESCDGDAVFRDAAYNDGDVAASFYDDFIRWSHKITYFYD